MRDNMGQGQAEALVGLTFLIITIILLDGCKSVSAETSLKIDIATTEVDSGRIVDDLFNGQNSRIVGGISVDDNPHWSDQKCNICHLDKASKEVINLRDNDSEQLCLACHADDVSHKYIHPAGMRLPTRFKARIKEEWNRKLPLEDNARLSCLSCHDVLNQCLPKRSYLMKLNPGFLREGPYQKRTDICYKCHDPTKYERLNSHDQIAKDGSLKLNACRLCHFVQEKGKVKSGIERNLDRFPLINNLDKDRKLLCIRCHKKIDHPTSAFRVVSTNKYRHLVKITEEKKKTLDAMKLTTGIIMPLEPKTERVYCGTCHEAHQAGVFSGELSTSMKGTNKRLRVTELCTYCHDK
jgi:predicted CXXCH cytochrome family protein